MNSFDALFELEHLVDTRSNCHNNLSRKKLFLPQRRKGIEDCFHCENEESKRLMKERREGNKKSQNYTEQEAESTTL